MLPNTREDCDIVSVLKRLEQEFQLILDPERSLFGLMEFVESKCSFILQIAYIRSLQFEMCLFIYLLIIYIKQQR